MASIFTFDPDPPRISSPWSGSEIVASDQQNVSAEAIFTDNQEDAKTPTAWSSTITAAPGVSRLEAEPQDGPTEYKLHLLLRPRKSLSSSSTGTFVPGSHHSRYSTSTSRSVSEASLTVPGPAAGSNNSRQHRLEQLTTQLLWRLQQSSPHHSTSANNLILPSLPEAKPQMQPPDIPAKLVPGLEESKGALYEIGVSDDGALIGLTMDEMTESLNNLKAMAASLGCVMNVLRMVCVGECEWLEPPVDEHESPTPQRGRLYVAEAYIKPDFRRYEVSRKDNVANFQLENPKQDLQDVNAKFDAQISRPADSMPEQLRVSLTGATTCGKSSLLGTLSTSTLDNSRGKSRLSMLKHRHELASGVTSSVVQELIGYYDNQDSQENSTSIINYATENVSSWTDIHLASAPGRLALISDSAGHPRYRRTTVRGLIGWAPHWVLLCIAANVDPSENDTTQPSFIDDDNDDHCEGKSFLGANAHISIAHLDLCLKLKIPLVVVVTKFDLASKSNFRPVLSLLLTRLKEAGRTPELLANNNVVVTENELQQISRDEEVNMSKISTQLKERPMQTVPILFTSAVKGTGITKLHALLRCLPIPNVNSFSESQEHFPLTSESKPSVFHVDDIFNIPVNKMDGSDSSSPLFRLGSVVSGHIGAGSISVGEEMWLGPFSDVAAHNPINNFSEDLLASTSEPSSGFLTPRSFNDALVQVTSSAKVRSPPTKREWRRVRTVSIRNLRMPVHTLHQDQVGTIGIVPVLNHDAQPHPHPSGNVINVPGKRMPNPTSTEQSQQLPIRKGMVLSSGRRPSSTHTFTADFHLDEASSVVVGTMVLIYSATVRASAKVVAVALHSSISGANSPPGDDSDRCSTRSRVSEPDHPKDHSMGDATTYEDDSFGFDFHFDADGAGEQGKPTRDNENAPLGDSQQRDSSRGFHRGDFDEDASERLLVTFQLVTYREWLEEGAKVLVMPGGPASQSEAHNIVKGIGGLEGLVGQIVQTFG